ncbi:MAG: restriction endonuclease subunit S [Flavobacteriales bacterium CG_4_9_14_0_2_um_filter_32_27]|nr:MAG: restriction endonuclease subunit S [Flavobacteriales bacterium CG_4_9_14_0_2_um_filter_32_27]
MTNSINKNNSSDNIPTLRFPEFSGVWEKKKFNQIYLFYSTNSFSRDNLNYENGNVLNIHYGDIHTKFSSLFDINNEIVPFINNEIDLTKIKEENYCKEGDLVVADASEDYNDIGKTIEIVNLNNKKVLAGLHTFLARPNKTKMALGFSGYLLKSWSVKKQVMTIAQGSKVLSLSTGRLGEVELNLPTLPEQQKIATFLTAVDSKIEFLQKKKSLLEQYKKGVMQQLFTSPLEREQRGVLRFKKEDGTNYPEWEEKKLGEVCEFSNGKGHEKIIDKNGKYVVVNSKFISTNGLIKKYCKSQIFPLKKREIVMVMSDVPKGNALAKCFLIDEDDKYTLNQRICVIREKKSNNEFLIYILNRNRYYLSFDSGVGQTNLKKEEVLNCPLFIPTSLEEQTQIANFLSAIDVKIDNCKLEIENYSKWKKGLLQQLFV